jgi:hypothetical protein
MMKKQWSRHLDMLGSGYRGTRIGIPAAETLTVSTIQPSAELVCKQDLA